MCEDDRTRRESILADYRVRPEALRSQPYVPGRSASAVQHEFGVAEVVRLSTNENPLGPSHLALEAIAAASREAHLYPDPTALQLRQALANRHRLPDDWIFVGNGSDEIARLLAASYIGSGYRVVVPDCTYPTFTAAATLFGAKIEAVPLRDETMDLEAMAEAAAGACMLFLCRPNNPTGAVFPPDAFRSFMDRVDPGTLVLLDQAYTEYDTSSFDSLGFLQAYPNLILTRTFSKAFGLAGLRVGYGLTRPEIWKPLLNVREPFSVNSVAQAAAVAALQDKAHLAETLRMAREGKDYLMQACRALGLACTPSETNFLMIDLGRPALPVSEALVREGVMIRPCGGFNRPNAIRVTIGTAKQNQRFADTLRQVLGN